MKREFEQGGINCERKTMKKLQLQMHFQQIGHVDNYNNAIWRVNAFVGIPDNNFEFCLSRFARCRPRNLEYVWLQYHNR